MHTYDRATPLVTADRRSRILASPHYIDGEFRPEIPHRKVKMDASGWMKFLSPEAGVRIPAAPLPSVRTSLRELPADRDLVVWLGHSSFYMQLSGLRILIDPVFSTYASPLPIAVKAFPGSRPILPEDLPEAIDLLALTHDHWDHLDAEFTKSFEPRVRQVVAPLGCGGYYERWGYPLSKIREEDWGTSVRVAGRLDVHILPTRHFSGRLFTRNQTQFAGLAFVADRHRVLCSGDGGYDGRFRSFGKQFGGFDLALVENGQYSENWPTVHLFPEQTALAAEECGAKALLPCHNSRYPLSYHPWREPLDRIEAASRGKAYALLTPRIGEPVEIGRTEPFPAWWKDVG